uniref:Transposase Tnp1/En/Spm-like domain-containing protein n=1 Tax=Aegilops tauschii TaxID=37682 RepID=M8BPC6_AEGTA
MHQNSLPTSVGKKSLLATNNLSGKFLTDCGSGNVYTVTHCRSGKLQHISSHGRSGCPGFLPPSSNNTASSSGAAIPHPCLSLHAPPVEESQDDIGNVLRVSVADGGIGSARTGIDGLVLKASDIEKTMYSYSVSFTGGKMASANGKGKDGGKDLIEKAEKHPEWKEKSIQEGDLFARNSEVEAEEDDDDGEEDDEEPFVHRIVIAKPPARSSSVHEDESLIGMDVLRYAWTGPETPVAKATIILVDSDTVVGEEPLGPATYDVLVNVATRRDAMLPYEYDGLRLIGDTVTRSFAWPSNKVTTKNVCFVHLPRFV